MDVSSREWRSGATPTTDCKMHLTLDFKIFLQKIQKIMLENKPWWSFIDECTCSMIYRWINLLWENDVRIVRLVLLVFAVTGNFLGTILESKLLMSYFYYYDYQAEMGKSEVFKVQVKSSHWNKSPSQVKSSHSSQRKFSSQVKSSHRIFQVRSSQVKSSQITKFSGRVE